jgi:hypothetical protein
MKERTTVNSRDENDAERTLERLFAHAKPRQSPPAADLEEIKRAVYAEWDAATGRRVFLRRAGLAAAASVLLAIGWWVGFAPEIGEPLPAVATVERVDGATLGVGTALAAGGTVTTANGQLALRLASGGSLRIGPQSRVVLTDADSAELVAGVLYFDSEGRREGVDFTVTTSLGSVRDVGTQFLARLDETARSFDIGVRDGRVELTSNGRTGAAGVGERLVVTQSEAGIRRDSIATFGGDWEWTERVAAPFEIDGRTVREFLDWFAAQTGRTVVFGNADAERLANTAVLHGAADFAPLQKLQAVLATTDFTYSLDGERVVIDTR